MAVNKISPYGGRSKKITQEEKDKVCRAVDYQTYFDRHIIPNKEAYYAYGVDFLSQSNRCKCPLHSEDTASFSLYDKDGNGYLKWHCFGACSRGGNIIDLHYLFSNQELGRNITYAQAYEELRKEFIEGRAISVGGAATRIKLASDEVVEVSTAAEVQNYYEIRRLLELYFTYNSAPSEVRNKIYNLADKMDILVKHNNINATKAVDTLKDAMKENGLSLEDYI